MSNAAKEARELVEAARKQGWRVRDEGPHFLLFSPDGKTRVTIAKTPSDGRHWRQNSIAKLRRGGFDPNRRA